MTDGEHIFALWLLLMGGVLLGFFLGQRDHKRRVLPQPRRMTK